MKHLTDFCTTFSWKQPSLKDKLGIRVGFIYLDYEQIHLTVKRGRLEWDIACVQFTPFAQAELSCQRFYVPLTVYIMVLNDIKGFVFVFCEANVLAKPDYCVSLPLF